MYGSEQKLQLILILLMLNLKALVLLDEAEVGGMKKRIAVCLEDMPLIIRRKQAA